ncbi:hypothetical protein NLM33_06380 [Bradyrhizobium sp. CCGUVB1N3]|uniref:hypothetical protein n=1 Tax=Bradyrhizobium sp. CCGUVB1N3 TaxID=2949629 RepID=UPI0020B335DD|nr:hypothetical protein [Bradyrhizobium sp. CCGUVB1N3]MCP3469955.1 hypothetical protein [Bradyrhizobium sp. CCGUVB1N3]
MEASDEFIRDFRRHLNEVDGVSNVILRGHLEVEGHLDTVLDLIFFRPEYLRKVRLDFSDKILLAKAYCPDPAARGWAVIKALSQARNSIAHRQTAEARAAKIAAVRQSISEYGTKAHQNEVREADDREVIALAAAVASGFLRTWRTVCGMCGA